jgi:hypothetical protein
MNHERPSFSFARRWSAVLNVAVSVTALLALLVMANYLGIRHFKRFHWAGDQATELSPRTRQVLAGLTNNVRVTVYYDSEDALYPRVNAVLREYQAVCPRITVERVDYYRDASQAKEVKARYKLTQLSDKDMIIFDAGSNHTRFVLSSELSDYDTRAVIEGRSREVKRTHFRGEMMFTSAILSVTTPRVFKAYFLRGHGEHDSESTDETTGYSKFAAILRDECNIPSQNLILYNLREVPPDCSLLIIGGPTDPFLKDDLDKIRRYLDQGGRLLVLMNFFSVGKPTGIEKLLAQYDIAVGNNLVVDIENSYRRTGQNIVPSQMGSHPIVARLQNSQILLSKPRSVRKSSTASRAGAAQVEELLFTGPNAFVVTDVRRGVAQPNPTVDPRGSVPLAVAAERGAVPGVSAERGATRLVVIGDSFFLLNDAIETPANADFATHTVNWLVDQAVLLSGVAPRPIKEYRINLKRSQMVTLRWGLLVGLPGSVLFIGLVVWWRRRS